VRSLSNVAGLIAAGNDLSLTAASLDNSDGTLGAVAGQLSANIAGAIDNTRGRIEAAQDVTLASNGLSNIDGTIAGNALSIDSRSQTLDNSRGVLVASSTMNLQSGALINAAGLIQAGDALSIDTHGQTLDNSGAGSSISGQRDITITSGALDNASGLIGAKGNLDITGTTLTNTAGGQLSSEADIALNASNLDNRGGQVQALGAIDVRASGDINNDASLIRAGRALNIAAGSLNNANTLGADQGLEGQSLGIAASSIDNHSGAMRADTTLVIDSSGALDNSAGLISSAQTVSLRDPSVSKTLAITNTAGTLIAGSASASPRGTRLDIDSASLSGDGKLLSQGDLAIKLVADFTHSGALAELTANGSASVETAGTLTNAAKLQAGTALTLTAASIDNQATGEILAPQLKLTATDAHTLTNRGLIDGGDTRLDAVTLNNVGTGRIYGDHLSIAATTLNNEAEGVDAPVIAARSRLDLAVGTLNNREGALIFSAGDLAIGGSLDGSNRATGTAGTINNASATIEALGDLQLSSTQLNNERTRFATRENVTSSTPVNVVLWDNGGGGNYKLTKNTVIQVTDTVISNDSGAGRILSGGNMALTGTVVNDKSDILAGGNLFLDLGGYTGIARQGQTLRSETGITTLYYRKECSRWEFWCDYKHHRSTSSAYNDGPYTLATYDLAIARLTSNEAVTGTATRIDNLNVGSVGHSAPGANGASVALGAGSTIGRIARVDIPGAAGGPGTIVATVSPTGTLPTSGLFHTNPDAGQPLVETDPRFASYRQWLSSGYMLAQLKLNPATTQKRLGDGFYEQRLINEQVAQLTGRRFLVGYSNEETQYRALLDAGVTFAKAWNLIPGVALSAEQMAQLTTDMVWLVEKDVTLANGSTQKVLAPQIYARLQPGDLDSTGALLAGNTLDLNITGDLTNMGTLAGRQLVSISADNIKNLAGRISGQQVGLAAHTDLDNIGGAIEADESLLATAGRNLNVASVTESRSGGNANARTSSTAITRLASLQVSNPGGTLQLEAGGDITLLAAHLLNTAPTAAGPASRTTLIAGNDIKLETVSESAASGLLLDNHNYRRQSETHETGSVIEATGNVRLQADRDVTARAASVNSSEGALVLSAGRDIGVEAGEASQSSERASRTTKSGFLSSKTTTTRDTVNDSTAIASTFSGDSTTLIAGQDIAIKGSNVVATNDVTLLATRDIKIESATETHNETHFSKTKQSGIFSSGGVGFTLGSKQQSTDQKTDTTLAAKSTVGSTDGNVLLLAGENYRQVGSDVISVKGDIDIAAKSVDILEARQTSRTVTETKSKQSGFTLAFTSPIISAIQTAQQMSAAAKDTKDGRMKLLAAANVGLAANNAADAVIAGQGKTVEIKNPDGSTTLKDNQLPVLNEQSEVTGTRDANAADKMGGIGINLSLGGSKSSSKSTQSSDTAAMSNLTAGRDIRIEASGGNEQSDITIQGSKLSAARNLTLAAEDEIKLLAAANTNNQKSTNQNSSASVGIGFMVGGTQNGFTIQAGVSGGQGKAKGNDLNWTNTQVEAGKTLTLESGGDAPQEIPLGDTTLRGAVAKGEQVIANVGKNLRIESLQDTSTYDSKQQSLGVSASLCIPPFCYGAASSGSVSASGSKVKSDFASVGEQSGIKAGDGGFQVAVKGDTDLKGGAITSTQQAINDNKNAFQTDGELTISDIQNKAEYTAKSASINVGTGFSAAGALTPGGTSAGLGKDGDKASSTTLAAISGVAGNTTARTGDAETGIKPIFDQTKVQKEIDAQVAITQMFNQLAPKAAADYAGGQLSSLKKQAEAETDPDKKAALTDEAKKWAPNGTYNIAMNIIIGAAGGNLTSSVTKETLSWAANEMRQNMIDDSKKFKGICVAGTDDCMSNMTGKSVGVNGSGEKIAGGRIVLADWCAESRCTKAPDDALTTSGYVEDDKGRVIFNPGKNDKGETLAISEFLGQHPEWRSPMGGHQGGDGQMDLFGIKFNYDKGSFWDKLAEAYAGTHDTFNSPIWYDNLGNGKNLDGTAAGVVGRIANNANVLLATPFAFSVLLPPEVWNAISVGAKVVK
jgi:filamentous hemagglutinin